MVPPSINPPKKYASGRLKRDWRSLPEGGTKKKLALLGIASNLKICPSPPHGLIEVGITEEFGESGNGKKTRYIGRLGLFVESRLAALVVHSTQLRS